MIYYNDLKIDLEDKLKNQILNNPLVDKLKSEYKGLSYYNYLETLKKSNKESVELTPKDHKLLFTLMDGVKEKFNIDANIRLFKANTQAYENATIFYEKSNVIITFQNNILNLIDDEKEIVSILGHELGHYLFEHLSDPTINHLKIIPDEQNRNNNKRNMLFDLLHLHSQVCELNADRIGLAACDDFAATAKASLKLVAGPTDKFGEYDINSFLKQSEGLIREGDYFREDDLTYWHPQEVFRVMALKIFNDNYLHTNNNIKNFDKHLYEILPIYLYEEEYKVKLLIDIDRPIVNKQVYNRTFEKH